MEQKVCLDTDVVIAILNNEKRAADVIDRIENATVYITTVTLFELMLRRIHLEAIEAFRSKVGILDFNEDSARRASDIFKELQKNGRIIEIRDIFIAAISITTQCSLSTFNKKHFENIKELNLV